MFETLPYSMHAREIFSYAKVASLCRKIGVACIDCLRALRGKKHATCTLNTLVFSRVKIISRAPVSIRELNKRFDLFANHMFKAPPPNMGTVV